MKELTVAASAVRKGDRIWWTDQWRTVQAVEPGSSTNFVDLIIYQDDNQRMFTSKHRREGVAIQRDE